jgi:integrase
MIVDYAERLVDYEPEEQLYPYSVSALTGALKRGAALAGVKKIRVHDLRHSHASMIIHQGFAPLLVKERLGHKKIETTLSVYAHLYPNQHAEVADRLDELNNEK